MAYNVVETTKVTGKCFDFKYAAGDIENGSLIAKGDIITGERNIYAAGIPEVGNEVFLVADPAINYDDARAKDKNEDAYIVKAGKTFRAYGLLAANHDKFGVQAYGITNGLNSDGTVKINVGDYVTVDGTTMKINNAGANAPAATYGFVGKVTEIENGGFPYIIGDPGTTVGTQNGVIDTTWHKVIIEVVKNENV